MDTAILKVLTAECSYYATNHIKKLPHYKTGSVNINMWYRISSLDQMVKTVIVFNDIVLIQELFITYEETVKEFRDVSETLYRGFYMIMKDINGYYNKVWC